MAKKRRIGKKGSFRGFTRRSSKRSGSSGENLMVAGVAAAAYGAMRPKIESWVQPVTSKLPIGGEYVDELALGTLGYFAAKGKLGSNKYIKAAGKAMFMIEAARIGAGVGAQAMNSNGSENGF